MPPSRSTASTARVVRQTLAANFFGPLNLTEALLPLVADGGAIVMVSSGMGELAAYAPALRERFADPGLTRDRLVALVDEFAAAVDAGTYRQAGWPGSAYRVSKAAIIALAKLLARELAPRGIRVNAVCPGWVRTRMGGHTAPRSVGAGRRLGDLGGDAGRGHRRLLPRRQADRLVAGRPWPAAAFPR